MRKLYQRIQISRLELVAYIVGASILTFELVAARIVAPYLGNTVYTWTSIIGVILAALAFGYARGGVWADKRKNSTDIILLLCIAAVFIALVSIQKDWFLSWITSFPLPLQLSALFASLALFAIPTFVLGVSMPYLARLSIRSVATSGRHLARIDAASTFGSLAGTFLTGYFLFGLIGTKALLFIIAAVLLLTTFLLSKTGFLKFRAVVAILLLVCIVMPNGNVMSGQVDEIDTAYSKLIIRDYVQDGRVVRGYQTGPGGIQSGIYLDGDEGQPFKYARAFSYINELHGNAKRYLIVGGGAFTLPMELARQYGSQVDVVEIDEALVGVSEKYFGFKQPSNMRLLHEDGRSFLNRNTAQYDIVYMDAYNDAVPPFQLLTLESTKKVRDVLSPGGIMAANIISTPTNDGLIAYATNTIRQVMPYVKVFTVSDLPQTKKQNIIVLASMNPIEQADLERVFTSSPEFKTMFNKNIDIPVNSGQVLTDNYAPVEKLSQ